MSNIFKHTFPLLSFVLLNCKFVAQDLQADSIPQLISDSIPLSSAQTNNPCENALEITISSQSEIVLGSQGANYSKDSKGNFEISYSEKQHVSFWYKLVFTNDCELEFNIFPGKSSDIYNFFLYKNKGEGNFCEKLIAKEILPERANLYRESIAKTGTGISKDIHINYKDTLLRRKILFQMPYHDAITAKSGDIYFLNIYHVEGTDCDHYLNINVCNGSINLRTKHENCSNEFIKSQNKITIPDSSASIPNDSKNKMTSESEHKTGSESAEKNINSSSDISKTKTKTKTKLHPQLIQLYEPDTLKQYTLEGEIIYAADPRGPLVDVEVYLINTDGSITILKKMYTNEKGTYRFANLPSDQNYFLLLNASDPKLTAGNEIILNGKIFSQGQPAEGISINKSVKSANDGSFTLGRKELFMINVNELFNRWSVDLANPAQYAEMLNKYGNITIEGLSYKVQIGAYREEEKFDYSALNDLGNVNKQLQPDGITRFVMGDFKTLNEADGFKQKVFAKKINDAFILAYFNGTKKYLEELIEKNLLEK